MRIFDYPESWLKALFKYRSRIESEIAHSGNCRSAKNARQTYGWQRTSGEFQILEKFSTLLLNPTQDLTPRIGGDGTADWKKVTMNLLWNITQEQHELLRALGGHGSLVVPISTNSEFLVAYVDQKQNSTNSDAPLIPRSHDRLCPANTVRYIVA